MLVQFHIEAENLDEAIVKAHNEDASNIEYVMESAEPAERDQMRVREAEGPRDAWVCAEGRAKEMGYHVSNDTDPECFARLMHRRAREVSGAPQDRLHYASGKFVYAPDLSSRIFGSANRLALRMIEADEREENDN